MEGDGLLIDFDAMAAAWGLPSGSWDSLDAGTPFDPAKAGILYTARHLPTPGRDGLAKETLDEIADLITAAGGRTLFRLRVPATDHASAAELAGRIAGLGLGSPQIVKD